jgi:hypothetical protein
MQSLPTCVKAAPSSIVGVLMAPIVSPRSYIALRPQSGARTCNRDAGPTSNTGVDGDERQALRAEGFDPTIPR